MSVKAPFRSPLTGARRTASPERLILIAISGLWLASVAGGLGVLAVYATSAPALISAPSAWPASSRIPMDAGISNMLVFMHPRCSCSSATLNELGKVLARTSAPCRITVVFFSPTSQTPEWNHTPLRQRAESLSGISVADDIDGHEAKLFGAVSSGHVVVYGPDGALRFHGGITASRGHEGDNFGEDCVVAALGGHEQPGTRAPTYGCEITPPVDMAPCQHCSEGVSP